MHNKKIVSVFTMGSLLTFAALLGAFAPIPVPSYPGVKMQIAATSDSDMNAPADNDTDSDTSPSSNGKGVVGTNTGATDNSAMNQGDQSSHAVTADQASNKTADRSIMSKIRKAVVADNTLSTSAHNDKIISKNGKVTLKGPVQSDQEKMSIEAKATEVAGNGNVVDKLTVQSAN